MGCSIRSMATWRFAGLLLSSLLLVLAAILTLVVRMHWTWTLLLIPPLWVLAFLLSMRWSTRRHHVRLDDQGLTIDDRTIPFERIDGVFPMIGESPVLDSLIIKHHEKERITLVSWRRGVERGRVPTLYEALVHTRHSTRPAVPHVTYGKIYPLFTTVMKPLYWAIILAFVVFHLWMLYRWQSGKWQPESGWIGRQIPKDLMVIAGLLGMRRYLK